jgi:hypothetical protein
MPQLKIAPALFFLASLSCAGCGSSETAEEPKTTEEIQQVHQNRAERMMKEGVGK